MADGRTPDSATPPPPKWKALASSIRGQISSGVLVPGDRLPSYAELRRLHGVSDTVIRNTMLVLKTEGWVDGVPGKGMYVVGIGDRSS